MIPELIARENIGSELQIIQERKKASKKQKHSRDQDFCSSSLQKRMNIKHAPSSQKSSTRQVWHDPKLFCLVQNVKVTEQILT